jgi:DNA-binding NarL/FixJ family response regulator
MTKIKVAFADDHPIVITGLQNILAKYSHITIVGTYTTGAALLSGLQQEQPDVLLLDIQLPDKPGDELTHIISKKYPHVKIIALTNFTSALYVNTMLSSGAKGYLLKTTEEPTLVEAIETVYKGGEFLEASLKEELNLYESSVKRMATLKATLTPREKEILQLIANGLTGQEIASKLFISFKTVEYYRYNILQKLDANNTATLIKRAVTLGLVK